MHDLKLPEFPWSIVSTPFALPLLRERRAWVYPAIGVDAGCARQALLVTREVAKTRIAPDPPLQAVGVIVATGAGAQGGPRQCANSAHGGEKEVTHMNSSGLSATRRWQGPAEHGLP